MSIIVTMSDWCCAKPNPNARPTTKTPRAKLLFDRLRQKPGRRLIAFNFSPQEAREFIGKKQLRGSGVKLYFADKSWVRIPRGESVPVEWGQDQ